MNHEELDRDLFPLRSVRLARTDFCRMPLLAGFDLMPCPVRMDLQAALLSPGVRESDASTVTPNHGACSKHTSLDLARVNEGQLGISRKANSAVQYLDRYPKENRKAVSSVATDWTAAFSRGPGYPPSSECLWQEVAG